jgi:hypothetical protein
VAQRKHQAPGVSARSVFGLGLQRRIYDPHDTNRSFLLTFYDVLLSICARPPYMICHFFLLLN